MKEQVSVRSNHWIISLVYHVAMVFIFTSSVMSTPVLYDSTLHGCFQCMTLMNREWNERLLEWKKCSGTTFDCGKCINRYVGPHDGKCTPTNETIIIEKSGTDFVPTGSNVELRCKFSEVVDCAWSRRGFHLNIGGRYSYISNPKGEQTKDCSIKIQGFNDIDNEDWDCKSMADSTHAALTSTVVKIFNDKLIIEGLHRTAPIPIGMSVVLKCGFSTPVDCTWSRDDHFVVIGGRYQYLTYQNGQPTQDCSIRISIFSDIDVGMWECKSYGDSSQSSILSASMRLSKVIDTVIPVNANNVTVLNGDNISLPCTFDMEVECQWRHNGSGVNNSGLIYKENYAILRTDCSIEIPSVGEEHAGVWACNDRGGLNIAKAFWITASPYEKPDPPNIIPVGKNQFTCSSMNGKPAAKLHWEVNGETIEPSSTSDESIHLDIAEINVQFIGDINTLKCIASHPTLDKNLVSETTFQSIDIVTITSKAISTETPTGDENTDWTTTIVIVAVVSAVLIVAAIIALLLYWFYRRKKNDRGNEDKKKSINNENNTNEAAKMFGDDKMDGNSHEEKIT